MKHKATYKCKIGKKIYTLNRLDRSIELEKVIEPIYEAIYEEYANEHGLKTHDIGDSIYIDVLGCNSNIKAIHRPNNTTIEYYLDHTIDLIMDRKERVRLIEEY